MYPTSKTRYSLRRGQHLWASLSTHSAANPQKRQSAKQKPFSRHGTDRPQLSLSILCLGQWDHRVCFPSPVPLDYDYT